MNTGTTLNLQSPIEIPVESLERELAALWKNLFAQEGEGALVRACSANMIAIARDRSEAELLALILARVSEQYPCRSIIAYPESASERAGCSNRPHMHAWISAHCTVPISRRPQICSEIITVAAYGAAVAELHNTLLSLVLPDLPVFIFWRSFVLGQERLIHKLATFSDVLVVDSHAAKENPSDRDQLLELLARPPGGVAARDLNWARLTSWRDLIAQFFDPPESRHLAFEISEVEICRAVIPGSIPTRTLLLTGWLAARLGWKRTSAERKGDRWISHWTSAGGEVVVRFIPETGATDQEPGITTVRLKTRNGPTLSVTSGSGATRTTADASAENHRLVHTISHESLDEPSLLIQELALTGEDEVFRAALAEAVALEKSY